MGGRLLAIGDIHGCSVALEALLEAIEPGKEDTVVTLGDYIDRGPDSRGVIDRLIALAGQTKLVPLQGNHEQMMLDVLQGRTTLATWTPHGGLATLNSFGFSGDRNFLTAEQQAFFDSLLDYFETDTHFFVHANYDPQLPLNEQSIEMLRWRSLRDSIPEPHISGRVAVVGHTANPEGGIFDLGHLIGIDTYCYGGGLLTAMEVGTGRFWQASQDGQVAVA
ncbi:metallophosphoesterase family protein [Candidatus Laterigemmans baculatus]|uniref:metallophosphoesterase family protein n=1 Tax=Candidatus Laterigemmans baculatus TaxID=2770505 RepID=UPI0013DB63FD|nr:metallophosphoesterase family protein [Candidatus Laterigemmans baculatus]